MPQNGQFRRHTGALQVQSRTNEPTMLESLPSGAKAQLDQGFSGAKFDAYEWLRDAMSWYEKAESVRPVGNDDAILR